MDSGYEIYVPPGFDDSEADAQVHAIARLFFPGKTQAEAFGKAEEWLSANRVLVTAVSGDYLLGEDEPFHLAIYFRFLEEDEPDPR
ncbi:hypothetical protein AB0K60_08175 [Thermopolyspora sp. NPDC052614]|uniref:hypothetical protein n=1 Tax=Thermopolyspora sp. NPDC052614 TaxID=3155682 RepID=UPI0034379EBB